MPQSALTLTRQSLYDLAWSKPMSELAKDFNISDVALAKRCRTVDVPIPYRGYWARKAAGQDPPKLPMPKYRTKAPRQAMRTGPEPEIPFTMPPHRIEKESLSSTTLPADEQAFQARFEALDITPATALANTCAAVRRTARHEKHPERASLPFARGERSGPIVNIDVTATLLDRALLLADRLIRTADALGWSLQDPSPPEPKKPEPRRFDWEPAVPTPKPTPVLARLLVDGVEIEFRIEERKRRVELNKPASTLKRRNQYDTSPPSYRMEATGALRVICLSPHFYCDSEQRVWYDKGRLRVEDKIPHILWRFQQLATRTLREKAAKEEAARKEAERERRARGLSIRRSNHAKLIEELERQAGAWFRAQLLQRYLRALHRAAGDGRVNAKLGDKKVDFLYWAEKYVDQLNPLSRTVRNPDQQRDRSIYWKANEEALKNLLFRLFGCENELPCKLTPESCSSSVPMEESEHEFDDD